MAKKLVEILGDWSSPPKLVTDKKSFWETTFPMISRGTCGGLESSRSSERGRVPKSM
jgi:hypothetical protein